MDAQLPDLAIGKTLVARQQPAVAVAGPAVEKTGAQQVLVNEAQARPARQMKTQVLKGAAARQGR